MDEIPRSLFFSRLKGPRSFSLSSYFQSLHHHCGPFVAVALYVPVSLVLGSLELALFSIWISSMLISGKADLPCPAGSTCAAQDIICLLCGRHKWWVHIQLGAHQDPQSFPAELYSSWLVPSLYFPRFRTLNLLNFMGFLWALSPASFLEVWMAAQCSGVSAIQFDPMLTLGV